MPVTTVPARSTSAPNRQGVLHFLRRLTSDFCLPGKTPKTDSDTCGTTPPAMGQPMSGARHISRVCRAGATTATNRHQCSSAGPTSDSAIKCGPLVNDASTKPGGCQAPRTPHARGPWHLRHLVDEILLGAGDEGDLRLDQRGAHRQGRLVVYPLRCLASLSAVGQAAPRYRVLRRPCVGRRSAPRSEAPPCAARRTPRHTTLIIRVRDKRPPGASG